MSRPQHKARSNLTKLIASAAAFTVFVGLWLVGPALLEVRTTQNDLAGMKSRLVAAQLDTLNLAHPVQLSDAPRVTLARGTISFSTPQAPSSPEVRDAIESGQAEALIADAKFVVGGSENANPLKQSFSSLGETLATLLSAVVARNVKRLGVEQSKLVIELGNGKREVATNLKADIRISSSKIISATGSFRHRKEQFAFEIILGSKTKAGTVPVKARFTGQPLTLQLVGELTLKDGIRIRTTETNLRSPDIRRLTRWLGYGATEGPSFKSFEASGPFVLDLRSASFEAATFAIDGNAAKGALALVFGGERPALQGTLAFEDLNLSRYVAGASRNIAMANVFSMLPLPDLSRRRSLLTEVDADLRISADSLSIGQSTLGRCGASISARNGRLFAEVAEIEFSQGGVGTGRVEVDTTSKGSPINMSADLRGVDFEKLGQAFRVPNLIGGFGELAFDLSGYGQTRESILSTASGHLDVKLSEGGVIALDLNALSKVPKAAKLPLSKVRSASTAVDRLIARVRAKDGVFTTEAVEATAGTRRLKADGNVNAAEQNIDLRLSVSNPSTGTAENGEEVRDEKVYRVRGPWTDLNIVPTHAPTKAHLPGAQNGQGVSGQRENSLGAPS